MVDAEYENIMQQLRHEASHEPDPKAALAELESEADEYRKIAERRVRLGLLLSDIGAANGVEVSQREMNQLIGQAAAQYQGKDRDRFIQYVQQEPMAAAQLRAPLYEDKVVDFLFSKADVTDRTATRAELEADLEAEEGHVHGPGCGHDVPEAKASKSKTKAAKPKAEKPAKGPVEESRATKPKPAKPVKDGAGSKPAEKKAAEKAEAKTPAAKKAPAKKPTAKK
jgi:trigger factor